MEMILFLKALSTVKLEKGWNKFLIFSHAYIDTEGFTQEGEFFKNSKPYEEVILEYQNLIKSKYEDAFRCRHVPKAYLSKLCGDDAVSTYFELKDKGYYFIFKNIKRYKLKFLEKMEEGNGMVSKTYQKS